MNDFNVSCPIPVKDYPYVLLSHGSGGKLMYQLINKMFLKAFENDILLQGHDAAVLPAEAGELAFTTDSYVVHPLFFPGGDIGSMAVYGTVNDLSMAGARPKYISVGFIIEEGLAMDTLWRIVQSMGQAAQRVGVQIATGDTKVVDKGHGDGIFINTAGIGVLPANQAIGPGHIQSGDAIIVSGDIGRHGIAIMSVRQGIAFETEITSDLAPLHRLVQSLLDAGLNIHCLRDLTRGGLATTLNEFARSSHRGMKIDENAVPVRQDVVNACEILGFDPLQMACEGRCVICVPQDQVEQTLAICRDFPEGQSASVVGRVIDSAPGQVVLQTPLGVDRLIDMPTGEQLPRIC
ncbi:MAG: hydrogenase expression/formation protein HypE [Candidatus Omnitrophica bacterium]|nr:hydrogenase expression/formation protein HypE [Candidatus Omnitrophota bacterium]